MPLPVWFPRWMWFRHNVDCVCHRLLADGEAMNLAAQRPQQHVLYTLHLEERDFTMRCAES